jgi:hypothetical protein
MAYQLNEQNDTQIVEHAGYPQISL